MREPRHPVGPAFSKAGDAAEAVRQQQIAALTDKQRQAFEQLQQKHQEQEKRLRETQKTERAQQIPERMRKHLLPKKEPHHRHDAHRYKLKAPQDLHRAVADHLAARKTRAATAYSRQLAIAESRAKAEITREQALAREKMQAGHRREQDGFLKSCARERGTKSAVKEFNEKAVETTRRAAPEFAKAAQDPSWKRAFDKAAREEAARAHERDRVHDRGRS